jgi:hypothetical protein
LAGPVQNQGKQKNRCTQETGSNMLLHPTKTRDEQMLTQVFFLGHLKNIWPRLVSVFDWNSITLTVLHLSQIIRGRPVSSPTSSSSAYGGLRGCLLYDDEQSIWRDMVLPKAGEQRGEEQGDEGSGWHHQGQQTLAQRGKKAVTVIL